MVAKCRIQIFWHSCTFWFHETFMAQTLIGHFISFISFLTIRKVSQRYLVLVANGGGGCLLPYNKKQSHQNMKITTRTYHPPIHISHRNPQSDFTWKVIKNVLVIVDLDMGNQSVTNDIHRVWHYIGKQIEIITFNELKAVIYKDSDEYFDGVRCSSECRSFYSLARLVNGEWLREMNMKRAIRVLPGF